MADAVFHFRWQFGKRLLVSLGDEKRVVAEAPFAPGRKRNGARARSFPHPLFAIGLTKAMTATKRAVRRAPSTPSRRRRSKRVVVFVGGLFPGKPGGADAGLAPQGVHFQPGVVCDSPHPCGRDGPCLQQGVFGKSGARLLHFRGNRLKRLPTLPPGCRFLPKARPAPCAFSRCGSP